MPNDMPKEGTAKEKALWFYDLLMMSARPQQDVKPFMSELQRTSSTEVVKEVLTETYRLLRDNGFDMIADYLKELYGYGTTKNCFAEEKPWPVQKADIKKLVEKTSPVAFAENGVITLEAVEKYCLNQCFKYEEVRAIYDMLLELFFTDRTPIWLATKVKIQKRMQDLQKGVLQVKVEEGGEFVMEKNVEYEVNHVDAGGTGISIQQEKK